jgi:hypothetical protein
MSLFDINDSGRKVVICELNLLPNYLFITSLTLDSCEISSLDNFPHIPSLKKLSVKKNLIVSGLKALGIAKLDNLHYLDLSQNPIWDFLEIIELENLPNLNELLLLECPVMSTPFMRKLTFSYIFNLHRFNGSEAINADNSSDEETLEITPETLSLLSHGSMIHASAHKGFKLYNNFSHCPIIKLDYKSPLVAPVIEPIPETRKRQLENSATNHTSNGTKEEGSVEKKRKENTNGIVSSNGLASPAKSGVPPPRRIVTKKWNESDLVESTTSEDGEVEEMEVLASKPDLDQDDDDSDDDSYNATSSESTDEDPPQAKSNTAK